MSVFDWDSKNEEHILRHDVEIYEAEEAMEDDNRLGFDAHDQGKKGILGQTEDGRHLLVIYTLRRGKYRVITARDLTEREKRSFRRRKK